MCGISSASFFCQLKTVCFFIKSIDILSKYGKKAWHYTRILQAILNKSWMQHPTKQQLYSHLPSIMKTIQVRQTRHVGHCWRSRDKLIPNILLWIPLHERAKAGWPARTYIQQVCANTGHSLKGLLGVMDDRDGWRERVRKIRTGGTTWW